MTRTSILPQSIPDFAIDRAFTNQTCNHVFHFLRSRIQHRLQKIENILYPTVVDAIVPEYALLYESMLGSVLHTRDRFPKPGTELMPDGDGSLWGELKTGNSSTMAGDGAGDAIGPNAMIGVIRYLIHYHFSLWLGWTPSNSRWQKPQTVSQTV